MASYDIRVGEEVNQIFFADACGECETEIRHYVASEINIDRNGNYIYICGGFDEYVSVRKCDIPNLIKALQKAQEVWE